MKIERFESIGKWMGVSVEEEKEMKNVPLNILSSCYVNGFRGGGGGSGGGYGGKRGFSAEGRLAF